VCLPECRARAKRLPTADRGEGGAYQRIARDGVFDLGGTCSGRGSKTCRIVLAYLRSRPDIDGQKVALWGDSFAHAECGGADWSAPRAPCGLYEDGVHAVAGQRRPGGI